MNELNETTPDSSKKIQHPLRKLLIFQLKLAVDAFRDILLSPVSIVCSILDFLNPKEEISYFEKLMVFGRNTEKKINLFEQHSHNEANIDSVLNQVESVIIKEYQDKTLSKQKLSQIREILKRKIDENKLE